MSERMFLVSRFGGQFHADDGYTSGKHICDVVHRIEQDGEGIRKQSDDCLETGQEDIDADSCPACPYDCFINCSFGSYTIMPFLDGCTPAGLAL